jgi:hypothetical protein
MLALEKHSLVYVIDRRIKQSLKRPFQIARQQNPQITNLPLVCYEPFEMFAVHSKKVGEIQEQN